ncbi:MAG: SPOR domain-containing protein [Bacteroidaceae bacterium]|nr:SPOR domain-containing protein [Bacteroidaceae bacterium]
MKRLSLILSLLFLAGTSHAQSLFADYLETDVPGEGKVSVERDARLDSLSGHRMNIGDDGNAKAIGYRIQVYAGNNTREAREKAQEAESCVRENFPDLPVYTFFKSPRWLCTAGDFLYYEEAYDAMRELKSKTSYNNMIILRNQEINISYQTGEEASM